MLEDIENCVSKLPDTVLTVKWHPSQLVPLHREDRIAILNRGSLTKKLVKSSKNNFSIDLITTRYATPTKEELRYIGLLPREISYVREVVLKCDNRPCVYARTVVPASNLVGKLRRIKYLKNQSIGKILFSLRDLELGPFQMCRFLIDDIDIVGRRRLTSSGTKKVLVSEFFLPASFKYLRAQA